MIKVSDIDNRQSAVITAMRFPLICLVLIAHSAGGPVTSLEWPLDGTGFFIYMTELISRHLCSIGVCWFYVFSGYFFFRYLQEGRFGWDWITDKWRKRIRTLLIPYLMWNLFLVFVSWLIALLYKHFGILPTVDPLGVVNKGPLYWFITGPADFPLYFMRDLMLMSLAAPVFYFVEKKMPVFSLILLAVFYLSCWSPNIPHYRAVFYFGLGAWLGIHKKNMLVLCRKIKIPAAVLAIVLLPLATALIGRPEHELARRLFFPFGMITVMNLCDKWIGRPMALRRLSLLAQPVFFIFAAHEIFILGWTKGFFLRVFGVSLWGQWLSYILVPFVVLGICLILYYSLRRIAPRTLAFVCGGRTTRNP